MPDSAFDLSDQRVCVILNPGSGSKDDGSDTENLRATLQPACAEFALREVVQGGDIVGMAQAAVDEGFDVIVAVGGDGTQAAVAGVLAGSDVIMGVVPGGTFNYFARDLGVGETPDEALQTILDARVETADIGEIEGLVFLNNVSLGIYPHILKTRENIYSRWGRSRIAAYWSVLVALRRLRRPMALTARVQGEEQHFSTALLFVARSAYQLESFGLTGADAIRDGQFAVLIAKARKPLPLLRSALRLAAGRSAQEGDFDLILTDELTIDTPRRRRQLVAHDGEKTAMTSPLHLKVQHEALRVLVPADGRNKSAEPGA